MFRRDDQPGEILARPQEQLLIEAIRDLDAPRRALCTSQGFGQLAVAMARQFPGANVLCHWLDLYRADAARTYIGQQPANLVFDCSADFPPETVELTALPFSAQGEAELSRELLQEAHERLTVGGILLASTDNPGDRWLHGELRTHFASISRQENPSGAVYRARKDARRARRRNFACELAFRDRGRLLHLRTRPGVFSHRKIDAGTRQLIDAMEIVAGDRLLDLGCGSGVVSLAAAGRAEKVTVSAVDSQARAVEATIWAARRNGLENVVVEHSAAGPSAEAGSFDVVAANPPYFASFRIARFFLESAHTELRPGGRIYVVSKQPEWYVEHMPRWFSDVVVARSKNYWIAFGRR